MGEGDFMPHSYHAKKTDPRRARKIREGGKKADVIKKKIDRHHRAYEVPAAEQELLSDLNRLHE